MNIKKLNIIYALTEPKELGGTIRYIGQSAIGIDRCKQHKKKYMLTAKTHKNNWIKSLNERGLTFDWIIIENLGDFLTDEARDAALNIAEIKWIRYYRDLGLDLTNSTDGGEGTRGNVLSPESRDKIRQKQFEHYSKNGPNVAVYEAQRKKHSFINNIEVKHCSSCDKFKELHEYSPHKRTWDKLNSICKQCRRESIARARSLTPAKKLTPEELAKSYADRKEKMRQGVIDSYKNKPELSDSISKARSKPIVATDEYGKTLEFASALEAKKAGFQNSNIGQAIKSGKPYKGYFWKFKSI